MPEWHNRPGDPDAPEARQASRRGIGPAAADVPAGCPEWPPCSGPRTSRVEQARAHRGATPQIHRSLQERPPHSRRAAFSSSGSSERACFPLRRAAQETWSRRRRGVGRERILHPGWGYRFHPVPLAASRCETSPVRRLADDELTPVGILSSDTRNVIDFYPVQTEGLPAHRWGPGLKGSSLCGCCLSHQERRRHP